MDYALCMKLSGEQIRGACRPFDHTWDRQGSQFVGKKSTRKQNGDREVQAGPVEPKFTEKQQRGEWISWKNTLGSYPVYLPPNALLSDKLIQDAHASTLHGGVGLTMTYIRRDYWIPRLRWLTMKVNHGVLNVKGFRLQPFKTHHQEICQLNAPPVQFLSKLWVWTMPVQFQTRPVPREKPEKPTSYCLQRCLPRVSSDS